MSASSTAYLYVAVYRPSSSNSSTFSANPMAPRSPAPLTASPSTRPSPGQPSECRPEGPPRRRAGEE